MLVTGVYARGNDCATMNTSTCNMLLLCAMLLSADAWSSPTSEPDLENGEEINELCAGCHGEFGQGGRGGVYPRLAGQPAAFIEKQMHLFRDRKRPNIPMLEYVDERQFPDQEIIDIAAYLAQIELPTRLPPIEEGKFDSLERLLLAKKVMNVPRFEGDVEAGKKLYNKECRSCHGTDGTGDREEGVPMLAGQYTSYLQQQVPKYINKVRIHDEDDPEGEFLGDFSAEELRDIFAFLSVVDD